MLCQEGAQGIEEGVRTIFGKEEFCVRYLYDTHRARYGLLQPVSPFDSKEQIVERPHD